MFRILVFYRDEEALRRYFSKFSFVSDQNIENNISDDHRKYHGSFFEITCVKGLRESFQGLRADLIAVQEELTWQDHWPELRDSILKPMVCTPIPIQIFDGISYEEAVKREQLQDLCY